MLNENQATDFIGATMYSSDGDKIGKVGQLFLDDETGQPEFVTVNTGFLGTSESFVPVVNAQLSGDELHVAFTKDQVKDAPSVDTASDGHLDESEEQRLYEYYSMGDSAFTDRSSTGDWRNEQDRDVESDLSSSRSAGHDTSGRTTDEAMTRSEEQVQVGTRTREAGRARLRKYVTTEQETISVPVQRERAVIETEPVTDANAGAATSGPDISEEQHEVVLNEEVPVVEKTVQPVERVRLGTETTTEEETVSEEVRKEHIEAEGDIERRR